MSKGRNQKLIKMRNEALFYRFDFLTRIRKLNFQETLLQLEQEFYLSENRIMNILRDKNEQNK